MVWRGSSSSQGYKHLQILSGVCEDDVRLMADVVPHLYSNLYRVFHHHHAIDSPGALVLSSGRASII